LRRPRLGCGRTAEGDQGRQKERKTHAYFLRE
jgi:hypothetical protein